MRIYFDSKWHDEEVLISAVDRGFMYGEGVYESLRTYNGSLFAPQKHFDRFKRSSQILGIPFRMDFEEFKSILLDGIKDVKEDCTIRVVLTNGDGKKPLFLVYIMELQAPTSDIYTYGVDIGISKLRKMDESSLPSALKTTSHANLMIARQGKENFYEVLMLNSRGFVAEGFMSNLFLVENNTLVTPSIETGILDGITREVVIDLAKSLEIRIDERLVNVDELFNCSECFLTRTSAGIIPVRKIENRSIFQDEPGIITQLLIENFKPYIFQRSDLW
ncbi:MAG: aminotransferase class IV [Thermotogae bacterium]|jgi:branched-chain amino acid aminotransferase|nr:aminotransferase class IV [Thermotogota bacterium]MCL5032637.1 aminotransferase class IV [Thermotogota bacterium]